MAHIPPYLQEVLDILRAAYPDGLPHQDYFAVLAVLGDDMSERNLAAVVAEFIEGEEVVVANDAAATASRNRPGSADVQRVRRRLASAGWRADPA